MTFVPPCRRPENNPEDWFIERDGKQYRDEVLVPDSELEKVAWEARAAYVEGREDMLIRAALVRRRHAKDLCWTQCIAAQRLGVCLELGMKPENLEHGTWGGYYSEERRAIAKALEERRKREVEAEEAEAEETEE